MGFDHTKLVVGKKYPIRSGGKAEFIGEFRGGCDDGIRLAFFRRYDDGSSSLFDTDAAGRHCPHEGDSNLDIISDEPIREPVEVKLWRRFMNVYVDGTGGGTHESIEAADRVAMGNRIGVYELPETILVQPK